MPSWSVALPRSACVSAQQPKINRVVVVDHADELAASEPTLSLAAGIETAALHASRMASSIAAACSKQFANELSKHDSYYRHATSLVKNFSLRGAFPEAFQ